MADDNDFEIAQQLGALHSEMNSASECIKRIGVRLDEHIKDEETRLMRIEHQLSLGRFILLLMKAIVLSIVFALAFKFGDIKNLWHALK